MNKLVLGMKREYWEYRRAVIGIPIILAVLLIMASAMATIYASYEDNPVDSTEIEQEQKQSSVANSVEIPSEDSLENPDIEADLPASATILSTEQLQARTSFRFMAVWIAIAWLNALYYLLSSLYSDRKDNSILYWKSLPISETRNIATKLIFGSICIPAVAVVIGWAVYLLMVVLGLGAINSPDGGESMRYVERTIEISKLFFWPLLGIVIGAIWGAPFFSYALMISAMSKRLPFMLLILPPIVLAALEGIFLRSGHLIEFFTSHFPFVALSELADSTSIGAFLEIFFIEKAGGMAAGLVLAAVFICIAVWYRDNRFEI